LQTDRGSGAPAGFSLFPAAARTIPKKSETVMPGIGNLDCLTADKENVLGDLKAALSQLRTWLHANTLADAHADVAGLGERLRTLFVALTAAGARQTLGTWHSGKGLGGWKGSSWEGQLLRTGSYVEGVMNGDHAAGNPAEIIAVQERMIRGFLGAWQPPYDDPKWIDFRHAVDEYAEEVLAALRPDGIADEDASPLLAPRPRLVVNLDTNTITIDGTDYPGVDPDGLAVFEALRRLKAEGKVRAVPARKLRDELANCHHDTTLKRWISKLPKPIRDCIKGKPGAGRWIELPPSRP
jgi:hypothetical protein